MLLLPQCFITTAQEKEEMAQNNVEGQSGSQCSVRLVAASELPHFTPIRGEFRRHL